MKNIDTKILIGGFKNRPVWAKIEVRDWNGYPELAVSFCEGHAFDISTIDDNYISDYYEEYFNCLDDASKLDFLHGGQYNLDEAINIIIEQIYDYRNVIDCSVIDYELDIDDKVFNFETISCGQYDIRTDKDYNNFMFTNEKAVLKLLGMWDKYHLNNIDKKTYTELLEIIKILKEYESEDFLKSLIEKE